MTYTRPRRRTILHFSQRFFTLGWTFIFTTPGACPVVRPIGEDSLTSPIRQSSESIV